MSKFNTIPKLKINGLLDMDVEAFNKDITTVTLTFDIYNNEIPDELKHMLFHVVKDNNYKDRVEFDKSGMSIVTDQIEEATDAIDKFSKAIEEAYSVAET